MKLSTKHRAGNRRKVLQNLDLSRNVTREKTAAYRIVANDADMRNGMNKSILRAYGWAVLTAALVCFAAPASAQYKPRTVEDPATGEKYHIEAGADFWFPTSDMTVSSESLGILGSQIDFKRDLGLTDTRFRALQLQLRPARSHKFRFQYIPVTYTQSATLNGRHHLQRDPLHPRPAGQLDARLEDVPDRLRVRLRRQELGLRRPQSRGEVHRRPGAAVEPGRDGVRARPRSHPGHRRHRTLLRRAEHLDHRRDERVQDSRAASTAATTRTTSTSTSTARSTSPTTSA